MEQRTIIEEGEYGFKVGGDLFQTLREAIEAAGPYYTFIPFRKS